MAPARLLLLEVEFGEVCKYSKIQGIKLAFGASTRKAKLNDMASHVTVLFCEQFGGKKPVGKPAVAKKYALFEQGRKY
ncbi:hypothetical protein E2562_020672 [Oryza meyeriana var. granulata]|uniref:Uncharacterized protein n=1 Tax=Oryza meyeriana var. granulata TaxID=110450 RepID=A0A6G1EB73_9ORYZ|nr:hypothetical protein E2562_020672 [Oryza meyeriana var. granulata]